MDDSEDEVHIFMLFFVVVLLFYLNSAFNRIKRS